MGMLSYPFWFFFEWLAPLIELLGISYFILIAILGSPNWNSFLILFTAVYAFAIAFSTYAILFEEFTFHRYEKKRDILKLFFTAWLEPIIFQPMGVWWALKGNWDYFIKKKSGWGKMQRKGFSPQTTKEAERDSA